MPSYRTAPCPACTHHVAVDFFEGGKQPLSTLGWPASADEARSMPRHALDFVRCVDCGHVFNISFDYSDVPYSRKPNRMFNSGKIWSGFIADTQERILQDLPDAPTVVEIGYGDGSFLDALSRIAEAGRFVGFDPHGATVPEGAIEGRKELFEPSVHLGDLCPDLLISRHVLEHLHNPLGFLQEMSFAAALEDMAPLAYFEVPCIDNAINAGRTVDFYYEHSSQFTTRSFTTMLSRAGVEIIEIGHGYDGEVVFGLVRFGNIESHQSIAGEAEAFRVTTNTARSTIGEQLEDLYASGRRVAIWGGIGKSAAFMCRYGVDSDRFPIVVDSDPTKADTCVPGTGQTIRFRDYLLEHPVEVLIIPPQWRAADILEEIRECGIEVGEILIEHQGNLVNFITGSHIYALERTDSEH